MKTTDEGLSAFMVSCLIGDVQIAELLLGRGASIHSTAMESNMEYYWTLFKYLQQVAFAYEYQYKKRYRLIKFRLYLFPFEIR